MTDYIVKILGQNKILVGTGGKAYSYTAAQVKKTFVDDNKNSDDRSRFLAEFTRASKAWIDAGKPEQESTSGQFNAPAVPIEPAEPELRVSKLIESKPIVVPTPVAPQYKPPATAPQQEPTEVSQQYEAMDIKEVGKAVIAGGGGFKALKDIETTLTPGQPFTLPSGETVIPKIGIPLTEYVDKLHKEVRGEGDPNIDVKSTFYPTVTATEWGASNYSQEALARMGAVVQPTLLERITPQHEEEGDIPSAVDYFTAGFGLVVSPVRTVQTWNDMSNLERALSIVGDIAMFAPIVAAPVKLVSVPTKLVTSTSPVTRTILNTAKTVGNTYKQYNIASKAVSKIDDITTPTFARLSSNLDQARIALEAVDTKFINSIAGAKLTARELKAIEKTTGFKGLSSGVSKLNASVKEGMNATKAVEATKVGSEAYAKALSKASATNDIIKKNIDDLNVILKARYKSPTSVEWTSALNAADREVDEARQAYQFMQLTKQGASNIDDAYKRLTDAEDNLLSLQRMVSEGVTTPPVVNYESRISMSLQGGLQGRFPMPDMPSPSLTSTGSRVATATRTPVEMAPSMTAMWDVTLVPKYTNMVTNLNRIMSELPRLQTSGILKSIITDGLATFALAMYPARMVNLLSEVSPEVRSEFISATTLEPDAIEKLFTTMPTSTDIALVQNQAIQALPIDADTEMTAGTIEGIKQAVEPSVTTEPEITTEPMPEIVVEPISAIEPAIEPEIEPQIVPMVEPQVKPLVEPQTQVQVKPQVKTEVKPQVIIETPIKAAVKNGLPVPIVIPMPIEVSQLTEEQRKGSVAWKQGWCYKLIYPPYGKVNIINSKEPFPGMVIHTGVQSAFRSLQARGGKLPPTIKRDMGIMDIHITTGTGNRPNMSYKLDKHQRTNLTPRITKM